MNKDNKKGFTLIELLVVIAIIGILSSIVMVSLNSARAKARDAKRQGDLNALQTALQLYADSQDTFKYPSDGSGSFCSVATGGSCLNELVTGGYIKSLPQDPLNTGSSTYTYYNAGDDATYCLYAPLENKTNGYFVCTSGGCETTTSTSFTCTEK